MRYDARGTNQPPGRPRSRTVPRMSRKRSLRFARGSLRLDAPRTAAVPPYRIGAPRVHAWRTEAINHWRLQEESASYQLTLHDEAERFFECPTLRPHLPQLRPDQEAAISAWERASRRGVVVKPTGTGKTEIALTLIARHIVYDEAPPLPGPTLCESALDCLAPMRLGLTATPWRADGRDQMLTQLIGPVVYQEGIFEARGKTLAGYS